MHRAKLHYLPVCLIVTIGIILSKFADVSYNLVKYDVQMCKKLQLLGDEVIGLLALHTCHGLQR